MAYVDATIEVTYLLFSGRPNPTWVMSAEQVSRFKEMISSLPSADPRPLRWQGFLIQNYNNVADFPDQVVVHDGLVDITCGRETTPHVDENNVESWLQNQALESPMGGLIREILQKRGVKV